MEFICFKCAHDHEDFQLSYCDEVACEKCGAVHETDFVDFISADGYDIQYSYVVGLKKEV